MVFGQFIWQHIFCGFVHQKAEYVLFLGGAAIGMGLKSFGGFSTAFSSNMPIEISIPRFIFSESLLYRALFSTGVWGRGSYAELYQRLSRSTTVLMKVLDQPKPNLPTLTGISRLISTTRGFPSSLINIELQAQSLQAKRISSFQYVLNHQEY